MPERPSSYAFFIFSIVSSSGRKQSIYASDLLYENLLRQGALSRFFDFYFDGCFKRKSVETIVLESASDRLIGFFLKIEIVDVLFF